MIQLIKNDFIKSYDDSQYLQHLNLQDLWKILKNLNQEQNNSLDLIEQYVYGNCTPMNKALRQALKQFKIFGRKANQTLIIFSDGAPTDGDPMELINELKQMGVRIITIYIDDQFKIQEKMLFSQENQYWSDEAKLMFRMSSDESNESKALRILARKRGWKLSTTGKSKLFVQANSPLILEDFTENFFNLMSSNDALFDLIGKINYADYINSAKNFSPREQKGGTCYANAVAGAYQMAMARIHKRTGGYPKFEEIRDFLIKKYGEKGANTKNVIEATAKLYRLHGKQVSIEEAKHAINQDRPLVAIFNLNGFEWSNFS